MVSARNGEAFITEDGKHDLDLTLLRVGYNQVADKDGNLRSASPTKGGDQLVVSTTAITDHNMVQYAYIFSLIAEMCDAIF